MTIYLILNGKIVQTIFTNLDYETLKNNWYVIAKMAGVEDLE